MCVRVCLFGDRPPTSDAPTDLTVSKGALTYAIASVKITQGSSSRLIEAMVAFRAAFCRRFPRPVARLRSLFQSQPAQVAWRIIRDPVPPIKAAVQLTAVTHLFLAHVVDIRQCEGPSMIPTLSPHGDVLLTLRLPFAALLQRWGFIGGEEAAQPEGRGAWQVKASKIDRTCGLPIKVGDVVVAASPMHQDRHVCKRILGLPGDSVLIDPRVKPALSKKDIGDPLNRTKSDDASTDIGISKSSVVSPIQRSEVGQGPKDDSDGRLSITVPPGHVFLVGDNLSNSTDSRHYGPIPMGCLKGKALALVSCLAMWPRHSGPSPLPPPTDLSLEASSAGLAALQLVRGPVNTQPCSRSSTESALISSDQAFA